MNLKRISSLFFSILFGAASAQVNQDQKEWKYEPQFVIGADVVNAGISVFSDRKIFQGFVSTEIKKDLHAVLDAGYEKNTYQKNGYDAQVSGPFLKIGGFYMLLKDKENNFNGFYGGGKLAASVFNQEYFSIPVRGFSGSSSSVAFPASSQSAYWLEASLGGRIQFFSSPFYADVNVQPRYLLYATKQENVQPLIIPGFGRSSGKFNIGFSWNLAYQF